MGDRLDVRAASARWLSRRRAHPRPAVRLYCFPHSGGAAGEYLRWADHLPDIEVTGVNLPGRGARFDEQPYTDLRQLVDALVDEVGFDPPFVLFGHSLGALVAYEVAQELRRRDGMRPARLVLSAYPPPHVPRQVPPVRHLDDERFLAAMGGFYGGLPGELLADRDLLELILPAFRADVTMLETYEYRPRPPLDVPLDVVGGQGDRFGPAELAQWRRYTTAGFGIHQLPGDHFYFRDRPEPLMELLRAWLGAGPA